MMGTGATVIAAMVEDAPAKAEPVRCWNCGQVIARRFSHGGYILLTPAPFKVGPDGRLEVTCPSCKKTIHPRASTGPRPAA